jgi:hypothetical protein
MGCWEAWAKCGNQSESGGAIREREEKRKLAEKQAGLAPTKANKKSKSRRVDSHATSGVMRVKDPTRGVTAAASFKSQGGVARRRH